MPDEEEEEEEAQDKEEDQAEDSGSDDSEDYEEKAYYGSPVSLGDDDRDFDFEPGETAKKACQDMDVGSRDVRGLVCCRYYAKEQEEERQGEPQSKKQRVWGASEHGMVGLSTVAKTIERLQLLCQSRWRDRLDVKVPHSICEAIGESLLHRLTILRVDNFPGSGDPIFGNTHERRRRYRAMEHDLFELFSAAFVFGGKCGLRRLTLSGGFMSAESFMKFLRVAKPPLESFRCRNCLFHGRNFEPLVKALEAWTTAPKGLLEFEMNACVGGKDPVGFLADAFPNLQMLRANRLFGEVPAKAGLKRLKSLVKCKCKWPKPSLRPEGLGRMRGGAAEFELNTADNPGDYRGAGLFWDGLDWTTENCGEMWVGSAISNEQLLAFMAECGVHHDDSRHWGRSPSPAEECSEKELEIFAVQVAVEKSPDGLVAIRGTTLGGREVAVMAVDPSTTLVRTVVEELARKYPCDCLSLRLALPNGSAVDVLDKGNDTLASVLH